MRTDKALRNVIHTQMSKPMWTGMERGVYEIRPTKEGGEAIEISLREAVLLRQIDRLLRRVVDENRATFIEFAGLEALYRQLDTVWEVLEKVRAFSAIEGNYQWMLTEDHVITFYLTEWDGALIERYCEFLDRVYSRAPEVFEEILEAQRRSSEPLHEEVREAA